MSAEMLDGLKALVDEKHEAPIDLIHEQCPAGGVGPGRECTACSAAGRAYLIGVEHVQAEVRALLAGTRDARRGVWNEGYAKAVRDNGGSVTTPAADPGNPYRPEGVRRATGSIPPPPPPPPPGRNPATGRVKTPDPRPERRSR